MNDNGRQRLMELLDNHWEGRRILVVGDVMLDKYIWGTVERISPEAPVPVVSGSRATHGPGGAANVAMNLAGLGANVTLVGIVGDDEDGRLLPIELSAAGIDASLVSVSGYPTTSKLRIVSGNQQMLRLDVEKKTAHSDSVYGQMIQRAREVIAECSAVILSDYAKGALPECVCAALISDARMLGIPALVDPKSASFAKYRNATTVCPNIRELSVAAGHQGTDLEQLLDCSESFLDDYGLEFLTVTLSDKGIALLQREGRSIAPAVARQVADVSGAGDTVIATLGLCLACQVPIEVAIDLANITAGLVIAKTGTVPVDRNEVIGTLSDNSSSRTDEKVLSKERLIGRVTAWRENGQRIVFTNGCYDLLHVGHIELLEKARQQGDRLVIAINSDDSVRRLKGQSRPVISENDRARVLAALSATDAVIIFDESTPLDLIREIRPDVLVKGGDYTEETVVGAPEVRAWGGRVCLIPLLEGVSTSKLIARLAPYNV